MPLTPPYARFWANSGHGATLTSHWLATHSNSASHPHKDGRTVRGAGEARTMAPARYRDSCSRLKWFDDCSHDREMHQRPSMGLAVDGRVPLVQDVRFFRYPSADCRLVLACAELAAGGATWRCFLRCSCPSMSVTSTKIRSGGCS